MEDRPRQPVRYGFGGRLAEQFPSQILVDVTEVCNLACIHCPHPEFKKSEHYSASYQDPELNRKMVDEVRLHGKGIVQYIRYLGEGEPLIHPKIFDMMDYAIRNSGTMVSLTTNGVLMTPKRARQVLDVGVNLVDISLDAFTPETYAKIRVNGDLEVTRANVLSLIRAVKESRGATKVVVSYVEQPLNRGETNDFEAFWKASGADNVVVRRLHSGAGAVKETAGAMLEEARNERRYPCLYPWERISINPRGELIFCPQDWVHGSVLADYRHTTIHETWRSETYRRLREAHLTNHFENHPFCGNCPDWKTTRWPGEGRAYADMVQELKDRK